MENCIFCKIAKGEAPRYKIWEDEKHIAFLNIYPNTEGVTLVIPKKHYPSYFADLPEDVLQDLIMASKKVAKLLDQSFEDVGRTGLVFEGFGVDHVHTKLYPMHGTSDLTEWKKIESDQEKFFEKYEGFLSTHDYKHVTKEEIEKTQKKIKK